MPQHSGPDDLHLLARSSPQSRDASLLRATTDLFCQDESPDEDAKRRYEELATYFLPKVAEADRVYVAERLADRPEAPAAVVRMLARDVVEVAAPVLRRSTALAVIDLLAVLAATGAEHRRLIASRRILHADVVKALRLTRDADVLAILDGGYPEPTVSSNMPPPPAAAVAQTPPMVQATPSNSEALSALAVDGFLNLESAARVRLIADVAGRKTRTATWSAPRRLDNAVRTAYYRSQIAAAAKRGDRPALIAGFAGAVHVEPTFLANLIDDPSGEALVLLCKAAGLSENDARTVLLLANPAIGQSVALFFRLSDLFAGMDTAVAESFIAAWREKSVAGEFGHVPHLSTATGVRARTEAARPAAAASEAPKRVASEG